MKLAFVGPPAVGKDAIANYIEQKYNITHISSGDIIRDYVKSNNLGELTRENLQKVGNALRAEKGGDVLVRIAFEKAQGDLIISGLRAIGEVETFKKLGGIVISISAPLETRYEFAKVRRRISDNVTFEEFKEIEESEKTNTDENGQNVDKVVSMADYEIVNNGSLEDLFIKCDELILKLKNEKIS